MNENDLIAEYVKENYPEILETYDFVSFKLIKAAKELEKIITQKCNDLFDQTKSIFDKYSVENSIEYLQKVFDKEKCSQTPMESASEGIRDDAI